MNITAAEARLVYLPVMQRILEHMKYYRYLTREDIQQFIEEEKKKLNGRIEGEIDICGVDLSSFLI
jgi:hypothetical protein